MKKLYQILLSIPAVILSLLLIVYVLNTLGGAGNEKLFANDTVGIIIGISIHIVFLLALVFSIIFLATRGIIIKKIVILFNAILIAFLVANLITSN